MILGVVLKSTDHFTNIVMLTKKDSSLSSKQPFPITLFFGYEVLLLPTYQPVVNMFVCLDTRKELFILKVVLPPKRNTIISYEIILKLMLKGVS